MNEYLRISLTYLDQTKIDIEKLLEYYCKLTRYVKWFDHFEFLLDFKFLVLQFELLVCRPVLPCFRSSLLFTLNSFGILALSNSRSSLIFYLDPLSTLLWSLILLHFTCSTILYSISLSLSLSFCRFSILSPWFFFFLFFFFFPLHWITNFVILSFQFTTLISLHFESHWVSRVLLSISNSILRWIHNFSGWNLILFRIIIQFHLVLRYYRRTYRIPRKSVKINGRARNIGGLRKTLEFHRSKSSRRSL